MEISEIRKKIIDKIKEGRAGSSGKKSGSGLYTLSAKMGLQEEDILKIFREAAGAKSLIEEAGAEGPAKRPIGIGSDNKKLKRLQEKSIGRHDRLLAQIEKKTKIITGLEKKLSEEFDGIRKEKEKALNNAEILKAKLHAATEGAKLAAAENEKKGLELKLQKAEKEKKDLEGKVSQLNLEIEAKNNRLAEAERLYRQEIDDTLKDAALKLQAAGNEKASLEEIISRLNFEMEAAAKERKNDKALDEETVNKLRIELERTKEMLEEKDSEIDARDKKIESDIKYYESLIREINEFRQNTRLTKG